MLSETAVIKCGCGNILKTLDEKCSKCNNKFILIKREVKNEGTT